jgi:hypothetical protein
VTRLTALLDACVIVPYSLGDTLLRAAARELYQVYFSEQILIETTRNREERGKTPEDRSRLAKKAQSFQAAVKQAFPDAIVEASPELEAQMTNHPGDRHVLASAVRAQELNGVGIEFIVTRNLKHFPKESLDPYQIQAIHPDDFLVELCDRNTDELVYSSIKDQASKRRKPPVTTLEMIGLLENEQPKFSARMLMYAHYDEIVETCHTVLKAEETYNQERHLRGNTYKICSIDCHLLVTEIDTGRVVLSDDDDVICGDIKVKDVMKFQELRAEAAAEIARINGIHE